MGEGAQAEFAVEDLAAAGEDPAHRHAAADIQMPGLEARRLADPGHPGDGALIGLGGSHIRAEMEMDRLHTGSGAKEFFQGRHGLVRLEAELGGEGRVFGIELRVGVDADSEAPVLLSGPGQQGGELGGRIQVDRQAGDFKARQPVVFGRAVDQDGFRGIAFGQGGPQFKLADDLDAPARFAPPAQERGGGLGFAGKPVTGGDCRLPIAD